jgi:hypothetical protein
MILRREMTMDVVDIWLISLGSDDREAVARDLAIEFGLSLERALEMTSRLPRVVQRATSPDEAERVVGRLRAAGLVAEVRPSAPVIELSPGGRPTRPSQPVPAAPPMSLFPRAISERAPPDRGSIRPSAVPEVPRAQRVAGIVALVAGLLLFASTRVPGVYACLLVTLGVVLVVWRAR